MYAFSGRVVSAQRLESNYLSLVLRREREGLLGDSIQVLVPTLVELRDGAPDVGGWAWVEALPAQARDLARGLSGFDYVAFRLMRGPEGETTEEPGVEATGSVLPGPFDRRVVPS